MSWPSMENRIYSSSFRLYLFPYKRGSKHPITNRDLNACVGRFLPADRILPTLVQDSKKLELSL
jgi:hypothetical protein